MKPLLYAISFLLLTACAAQKVAVDYADTLLERQITKRLPLYSQQKNELSKDVDTFLKELKPTAEEILPFIEQIDASPSKAEANYKKLEQFYLLVSKKFNGLFAKYMAKLDTKQQKEFFTNLDDENRELKRKSTEDLMESLTERFEMFLGPLKDEQKKILASYSPYFAERTQERVANRGRLKEKFSEIYQSEASKPEREQQFESAFKKYQEDAVASSKNIDILQSLIPTLSDVQKEHFRKKLLEVKELISYYLTVDY